MAKAQGVRHYSSVRTPALRPTRSALITALLAWALVPCSVRAQAGPDPRAIERSLFNQFLAGENPAQAERLVDALVATGVSFDAAFARLRQGRSYAADVPRGRQDLTHRIAGLSHRFAVIVPQDYDPARAYPVRVQLHGGVG